MKDQNLTKIKRELTIDARGLGIPSGSAEIFIERALKAATKLLKSRPLVTEQDLKSVITKELHKYHKDFAYVYQNRDKII